MPRGVYDRKKDSISMPVVFPNVIGITKEEILPDRKQFTESVHYDEILAVRVLRKGPFRGLWELVRLDDQGKVKQVLTDANSRGMIITMMNRSIMRIVVAM